MTDKTWKTAITEIEPNKIKLRGYPLDELMGNRSFADVVYLALRGELPTPKVGKLIDAMLVSSIDHGVTPPSVLTAMTVASTGASLNSAVAAGILAISKFHGGAIEACMGILQEAKGLVDSGRSTDEAAESLVSSYKEKKKRMSGFGHRVHTNDPRTPRLFELAEEAEHSGIYIELIKAIEGVLEKSAGKKLPVNVDGAIAAVLCELDFWKNLANAFFIMARVPGLVAHVAEEQERQRPMRTIISAEHEYDGPAERHLEE